MLNKLVEQIVEIFYSMLQEPCYSKAECYCDDFITVELEI